jgi:hypothetical protein
MLRAERIGAGNSNLTVRMTNTWKCLWARAAFLVTVAAMIAVAARADAPAPAAACRFAGASVQLLATVVTTRDTDVHCLGLDIDADRNITDIRIESHKGDAAAGGVHLKRFPIAAIGSDYGAVLDGRPGHDALILQGRIAEKASRAQLVIRYLHNGITGEFRSCALSLDKNAAGDWTLVNAHDRVVSRIVVKNWKIPILGTVGIETLEGVCAA